MSEYYYRYNSDNAPIDLDNDEIYDYVLEREKLKELDNVGPKCIRDFGGEYQEHFGNLKGKNKSLLTNLFVILLVIVALYLLYSLCCGEKEVDIKPGKYVARFNPW